eukprot:scaffold9370_cov152-Skeletonema_marinoi.AAC.8
MQTIFCDERQEQNDRLPVTCGRPIQRRHHALPEIGPDRLLVARAERNQDLLVSVVDRLCHE